jgi:DNA-binding NarL/FixJ family response regulator
MLTALSRKSMPARRLLGTLAVIQMSCAVLFGVDITYELWRDLSANDAMSPSTIAHLAVEVVAVLLLVLGYALSHRQMNLLRQAEDRQSVQLRSLRGHFDDIVMQRFGSWNLSPAESDIALLSLRGLKIAEIAHLRETKEGTIKAQLSAIFRKAGVSTRNEFLGLFLDDFLDFGAMEEGQTRARPSNAA